MVYLFNLSVEITRSDHGPVSKQVLLDSWDMQMKGELPEKVLRDIDMEEDIC